MGGEQITDPVSSQTIQGFKNKLFSLKMKSSNAQVTGEGLRGLLRCGRLAQNEALLRQSGTAVACRCFDEVNNFNSLKRPWSIVRV